MFLAGDNAILAVLRAQAEHVVVSSREMTGVGFFTRLVVEGTEAIASGPSFKLGDVNGTANNVQHGLGFLLYVKDGVLSALEGYTYDEPWPDELHGLQLTYSDDPRRDLVQLDRLVQ